MALVPLRCGNSNRADLQQIANSLFAQRGDAITNEVGSVMWIETQAWARALYHIWAVNTKLAYQFDPHKMTDFLPRWEAIMGLAALPGDTIQVRQERITQRFALINKPPTDTNVTALLEAYLGTTFLLLINTPQEAALAYFPGGVPIVGGITNIVDGAWLSTVQQIFVEVIHPTNFTNNQFYAIVNQVFPLLNNYLPAYDTFDWFWDSFSDDGNGSASNRGLISITVGSNTLTGVNTAWNTVTNVSDGTYNVEPGSILECYDDNGIWQRLVVDTVNSDTSITLTELATATITSKIYVIEGFFLDCDSTQFPYPPVNCLNLDNAGLNAV